MLNDRGVGVQPECPNHGTHDEQTRCHDEWGRPRAELGQNAEDQRGERAADVPLARCHSTGVVPNHGRTNVATAQARGPANDHGTRAQALGPSGPTMIVRSYLVTLWALLCVSCGPTVAQSVAVFDFELIDTSLEGAIRGARSDEQERLARVSDQLRQTLRNSGQFSLVDITPIASEAQASNLQACGGCDMRLAQRIGAELAITGTVQKVWNSNPQHEHLRSRGLNRSDHCGHERGHARQYRRDVVTHARLAGLQSPSRVRLWPPAIGDSQQRAVAVVRSARNHRSIRLGPPIDSSRQPRVRYPPRHLARHGRPELAVLGCPQFQRPRRIRHAPARRQYRRLGGL